MTNFRAFKTCHSFWKKVQSVFPNEIQQLIDVAHNLTTPRQIDHDMVAYVSKAQSTVEGLKLSLEANTTGDMKEKLIICIWCWLY